MAVSNINYSLSTNISSILAPSTNADVSVGYEVIALPSALNMCC